MKTALQYLFATIVLACTAALRAYAAVQDAEGQTASGRVDTVQEAYTVKPPQVHGVLRTRAEAGLQGEGMRFQVRNARLTLDGSIAPPISYFVQADLCDRGKMKILDAWGRLRVAPGLDVQAGQFRMPFGTDCFRAPANYVFANRSYLGKQMCNVRGVGAKVAWAPRLPFERRALAVEAGVFNPTSMADHDVWVKTPAMAGKASWTIECVTLAAGAQSLVPDSVRINLLGGSCTWRGSHLTLEGEYMYKHYTRHTHRPAHAWVVWADWGVPVKAGVFNRASVQARWDGLTPHSDGKRAVAAAVEPGDGAAAPVRLLTQHDARQRITLGGTLTYTYDKVHCDLRLDWERCFRHSRHTALPGDGDKLLAEMVIRF